jgi:hypothetical protein
MDANPDRSFFPTTITTTTSSSSSSIPIRPSNIQSIKQSAMSLRATTPYYSSAHTATARKVSTTTTAASNATGAGTAAGASVKEGAKGLLKSPWIVGLLPFVNGGLSGMVVSPHVSFVTFRSAGSR